MCFFFFFSYHHHIFRLDAHVEYRTVIRSFEKSFRQVVRREKTTKKYDRKKRCTTVTCALSSRRISRENTRTISSCHHVRHTLSMRGIMCVNVCKIGEMNVTQCARTLFCVFTFVRRVCVCTERCGETECRVRIVLQTVLIAYAL